MSLLQLLSLHCVHIFIALVQLTTSSGDVTDGRAAAVSNGPASSRSSSSNNNNNPAPLEYCLSESFNASCPPGGADQQVLLISSAVYGRMRSGRCIQLKYGHAGCRADVLPALDESCSGRPSCSFPVARLLQSGVAPCDDELKSYLEASYSCVKVSRATCSGSERQRSLVDQSGYLSVPGPSPVGAAAAGSARCPWKISVDRRQGLRVSRFAFGGLGLHHQSAVGAQGGGGGGAGAVGGAGHQVCPVAAVFDGRIEKDLCTETTRSSIVNSDRLMLLYATEANELTLYFKFNYASSFDAQSVASNNILLYYEATGCPTLKLPDGSGAWIQQDPNTATIRCNRTDETWFLQCEGRHWKGTTIGNCSSTPVVAVANDAEARMSRSASLSLGLIVAVVIGVLLGVVIGAVPLGLAYVCLRRKWRQAPGGYLRGDEIYDPTAAHNKASEDGRSMYPALMATSTPGSQSGGHLHHHHQQQQQRQLLAGYYGTARCPNSATGVCGSGLIGSAGYHMTSCGQTSVDSASSWADGGAGLQHECVCPERRSEHVYESAAGFNGGTLRGGPERAGGGGGTWIRRTDESYMVPAMTGVEMVGGGTESVQQSGYVETGKA